MRRTPVHSSTTEPCPERLGARRTRVVEWRAREASIELDYHFLLDANPLLCVGSGSRRSIQ